MRIAQDAPLIESVPPKLYGGTERIVSYHSEALVTALQYLWIDPSIARGVLGYLAVTQASEHDVLVMLKQRGGISRFAWVAIHRTLRQLVIMAI